jgi:Carboxypeptidase regulatory-like domain
VTHVRVRDYTQSRSLGTAMRTRSMLLMLIAFLSSFCLGQDLRVELLARATQIFGMPLSEHDVFKLDDRYVLWLITTTDGNLFEIVVGPKSYYSDEFRNQPESSRTKFLSQSELEEALSRISKLKEIGRLKQKQYSEMPGLVGPLQTDEYDKAFVEKVLRPADSSAGVGDATWKFSVYFIREVSGSPKQIVLSEDAPSQVCLGSEWYYLKKEDAQRLKIGQWTTFNAAGTEAISRQCFRRATLYDADGFTIEDPQTETILAAEPYSVRALVGRVQLSDTPLEGVNVEVLAAGKKKNVLRTKTDADGRFKLLPSTPGRYKFKVSKDGFKALTGTIVVDPSATATSLSFELPVGT